MRSSAGKGLDRALVSMNLQEGTWQAVLSSKYIKRLDPRWFAALCLAYWQH
jgi:hypothetical protein